MKSELQVVKSLVKKYSDDKKLGGAVRRFLTQDYWIRESKHHAYTKKFTTYGQDHKEAEREWLGQLDKI